MDFRNHKILKILKKGATRRTACEGLRLDVATPRFRVSFATLTGVLGSELSTASVEDCMWILHESQKSCSLLEMGTSPFLVRLRHP